MSSPASNFVCLPSNAAAYTRVERMHVTVAFDQLAPSDIAAVARATLVRDRLVVKRGLGIRRP
jgi:hypothetical protein